MIVIVFALLILAAAYNFWLRPEFTQMQSLQQQVKQLREEATAEGQANMSGQQKTTGSSAGTQDSHDTAASRLPSSVDLPNLLSTLAALQAQTHVTITNVQQSGSTASDSTNSTQAEGGMADPAADEDVLGGASTPAAPQTTSGQTGLPSLSLSLQIQGTAAQVEQFLAGVQHEPQLMGVNNLTLGSTGKTVTASLQLNAYYAP